MNRDSSLYEPNFDVDFAFGQQGQLYVESVRDAFATGRVEVKRDARALETGNFYIEQRCRFRSGWAQSGINTTEAQVWAFLLGPIIYVIPVVDLRQWCDELARHEKYRKGCLRGSHPTTGVLLPLSLLRPLAARAEKALRGAPA